MHDGDPGRGSGLLGPLDRVDAVDGAPVISSPVGDGTTVHAAIPVGAPDGLAPSS